MFLQGGRMAEHGYTHKRSNDFGKVPQLLMHDPTISHGAVRLYAHMHWRYGSNMQNFESLNSMAEYMTVSVTTIRKWAAELEARDWLIIRQRKYKGQYTSNFYHVFEDQADCIAFRRQHKWEKPKYDGKTRQSRKGIGGNPKIAAQNRNRINSSSNDHANSSSDGHTNSSSNKPDSPYPDSKESADAIAPAPPAPQPTVQAQPTPEPDTVKAKRPRKRDPLFDVIAARCWKLPPPTAVPSDTSKRIGRVKREVLEAWPDLTADQFSAACDKAGRYIPRSPDKVVAMVAEYISSQQRVVITTPQPIDSTDADKQAFYERVYGGLHDHSS